MPNFACLIPISISRFTHYANIVEVFEQIIPPLAILYIVYSTAGTSYELYSDRLTERGTAQPEYKLCGNGS